jgi:hypothetical protein
MEDSVTLGGIVKQLPAVLAEAAKLQNPVLDATIVADVIAVVSPFGVNVGTSGAIITNALVAVGVLATAVQKAIADLKPIPVVIKKK